MRLGHLGIDSDVGLAAANVIKVAWTELVQDIDRLMVSIAGREALTGKAPSSAVYDDHGEIRMLGSLASYFNNRAASIYGGSNEIQRNLIYRELARGAS